MEDVCKLRKANGESDTACRHAECVFWRAATGRQDGCAIQYFQLLGDDEEMSAWLLALKKRLEGDWVE